MVSMSGKKYKIEINRQASDRQCIYTQQKKKKYPINSFHACVNRGENTLLLSACLAMLTVLLCRMAVHFGLLYKC